MVCRFDFGRSFCDRNQPKMPQISKTKHVPRKCVALSSDSLNRWSANGQSAKIERNGNKTKHKPMNESTTIDCVFVRWFGCFVDLSYRCLCRKYCHRRRTFSNRAIRATVTKNSIIRQGSSHGGDDYLHRTRVGDHVHLFVDLSHNLTQRRHENANITNKARASIGTKCSFVRSQSGCHRCR
jgi:hypothetical protein